MESGTLADRGVPEVLRALGDRRATGCLHIARGSQMATVWLDQGTVYTAQAPEARARLGDRLVGAGVIDQSQLEHVLDAQQSSPTRRRIGELLVERGMIDRETLRQYVQAQILDSVTATLSWRDGTWRFEPGRKTSEDAPLSMSLENLLMDATRRLEEWEVIQGEIGSLDAVVDFAPRKTGAEVALTSDEWSLMTRIDGVATVAEIADQAGYGQFETARIVYGLVTAGIVHVMEEDEEPLQVDRESLLAEFAALGESEAPRPVVRERFNPSDDPRRSEMEDRRSGLFERFRRG